jgi:hypothetical protein
LAHFLLRKRLPLARFKDLPGLFFLTPVLGCYYATRHCSGCLLFSDLQAGDGIKDEMLRMKSIPFTDVDFPGFCLPEGFVGLAFDFAQTVELIPGSGCSPAGGLDWLWLQNRDDL